MMPNPTTRPTVTIEEAAKLLGISRSLAYEQARKGEIPVLRFNTRFVVPTAALLKLLGADAEPAKSA
jgi:excisionase family DNA binding protein